MAFVIGGEVSGSHWLLHNHFSCDRCRIRNGIRAHQSHSIARLDRSYQWIRRRAHHGGDDVDRYKSKGNGAIPRATVAGLRRLGGDSIDRHHGRCVAVVIVAVNRKSWMQPGSACGLSSPVLKLSEWAYLERLVLALSGHQCPC